MRCHIYDKSLQNRWIYRLVICPYGSDLRAPLTREGAFFLQRCIPKHSGLINPDIPAAGLLGDVLEGGSGLEFVRTLVNLLLSLRPISFR